ncbi:ferric reductase-like transmembrane domain-containing protein [Anabaena cylindrica FACHB-243]|uniref:Ferric reductase domain protein transmembrane component domain protein n=1 Tax=Anabaena cylindrica (strain ATCC 27899 / PCC 7122) TaxID=272123 RepID=K9ZGP4_ANACC|nr:MULTISPECIES: ferric reductase-like transmembrane domain-containing protein [Anabaena]AFZ58356.1 Ferric reductase domain protein transmembrane component domain protein [Anabaena cylindrica PCC 7122]MBD2416949.1 ferric reductase-like transmembrane domain-containing protein [Anabaena cylindrica FACHB-243]MBY5281821.1 iron reductase [Anabaena sp. CCAP 1446/1C]MBY5308828.1 iron reductase [Anabaena sp. CCAP 1446/1C]MCM2406483.1 ferric reductase-like transmembrane domain-containing protein [Anaba
MLINASISSANLLGFISLLSYILTLLPSSIRAVFPQIKKAKITICLWKYRRQLGVVTFVFALVHTVLIVNKRNLDLFDIQTYEISLEGTLTLIIFVLLAFTSNDWSVKKMKQNWRRLHKLTYIAMFLLLWHIQEKMSGQWNILTPIELILITVTIGLFCRRRWLEYTKEYNQKQIS